MVVRRYILLAAVLVLAANAAGATQDRPVTVSPGGSSRVEAAAAHCPTFSWGGVGDARSYEIVIYELAADDVTAQSVAGRRPTLGVTVPGSASSWTPAADRCLAGGISYVWFVRALGQDTAVSGWSDGGMFRTPAAKAPADLRDEVLQIVERYLATLAGTVSPRREQVERPVGIEAPTPPPISRSFSSARLAPSARVASIKTALQADQSDSTGQTFGVLGTSNSSTEGSAGVAGFASAISGQVAGVAGFNDSVEGFGVFGENLATTGGVGVFGQDAASSGITSGVVGVTQNTEGYGGFFWNESGGDALVVADPELHPASVDVKLFVDVEGNLGLVGVVKFEPTDTPSEGCIEETEGSIYYDDSEDWLCVCTKTGTGPDTWGYMRADDNTDAC